MKDRFDELMHRYIDRVYGFVYHMTKNAALAEDATQEAFLRAWKNMRNFESGKDFRPWIFAIAKNVAIDMLRKRKDVSFSAIEGIAGADDDAWIADSIEDDAVLPDVIAENNELAAVLDEALAKISAESRAVVILHDREDMTFEEIASSLGQPMNTVKSRYRRALIALQKILIEKGYAPK